ncbi:MAG: sialidase family protein [Bacteroidales bacterium]|nr:sialidase family protein [Bacteroidales bacterium]
MENTFSHIFDYRNPEKNCGAILLGFTTVVPESGVTTTFRSNLSIPAGDYVIYLVADMKTEEEIGGLSQLPLIGGNAANFTRVGGVVRTVAYGGTTHTINYVNNFSADGGGRVIVPQFKMLYAPRYEAFASPEEYSRYYRIPAITRTANGTLVAMSDARKEHIHDVTNSIDVVTRRSSDNGKTWSSYFVVFQGSQEGSDCKNWLGYGDAAVAAFPNGSVMATAIHGYGLAGGVNDPASDVVWKISRDNGMSWSREFVMPRSLYGGFRGCISPGNICVPQTGYLKYHALGALRTSAATNNGQSTSTTTSHVYFMNYDPETNTWSRITVNGADYIADGTNLDEAQFVELGTNTFLLTIRSYSGTDNYRAFYRVELTSATTATATRITTSGMTLAVGCNGDAINYRVSDGTNYLLHTVPKDMVYTGDNCRSGLSLYYAPTTSVANGMQWTRSLDLFDPFDNTAGGEKREGIGALDETAQYSSIVAQGDYTVGVVMEAYPKAIRHKDNVATSYNRHWGDWVMGQYYINLRIGDIIPDAQPLVEQEIDAPTVVDESKTYCSTDPADRPTVTISHQNYATHPSLYNYDDPAKRVSTYYVMRLVNAEGEVVAESSTTAAFLTEEKVLTWEEVWGSLVITGTDGEHYTADPTLGTQGYMLQVMSRCVAFEDPDIISDAAVTVYTFDPVIRRFKVVGVPSNGAGEIHLSTEGGHVHNGEWLTAGVGKEVIVNTPANYPYVFENFYYTYGDSEKRLLSNVLPVTLVSDIKHHISFTSPTFEDVPDNYGNEGEQGIVIYAVYKMAGGFTSRVNTQYNNGAIKDADGNDVYQSQFSFWTPTESYDDALRIVEAQGGDTFGSDLEIPTSGKQDNKFRSGTGTGDANGCLSYPQSLNYGLDAYVTLVPDANSASELNAVVRVKKGGEYLDNYYVVNGYNHPLTSHIIEPERGCVAYLHWYDFENGALVPKAVGMQSYEVGWNTSSAAKRRATVSGGDKNGKAWYKVDSDIAFAGICAVGETTFEGEVEVEIYLVDERLTSVDQLSNTANYVAKVVHPIIRDQETVTGVLDVNTTKEVAKVTYYNLLGQPSTHPHPGVNVRVTTYTDGTTTSAKFLK